MWHIGIALNRLAFAFGADLAWRIKYSNRPRQVGAQAPTKDDLDYLNNFFVEIPYVLDLAIDWYHRGRSSRNPFTAFLCFFVAMEVVVEAAYSDAALGIEVLRKNRIVRRKERRECIQAKYQSLYESDPEQFVREAYFDCVRPLRRRRREVCERVFGKNHPYWDALFQPSASGGESLEDIRNYVAHGHIAHLDQNDLELVRERLHGIAGIVRDFITRVVLRLNPQDAIPTWSKRGLIGVTMSDPRATQFTSSLDLLPNKDWTIRAEWCA